MPPEPLFGQPDPSDITAPLAAVIDGISIQRGAGTTAAGQPRTSCDDLGWITIRVGQPESDPHTRDEVGYLLELEHGALPVGMVLADVPWIGDTLVLPWLDVGDARSAPVAFTLRVTAVDRAANRAPSVLVQVHEDVAGCGCQVGPSTPTWPWLLLGLFGWGTRRER